MKKKIYYIYLRIIIDVISFPLILLIGYSLKFKVGWVLNYFFSFKFLPIYSHAQVEPYFHNIGIIIVIWVFCFSISGVYKTYRGILPEVNETIAIFKGFLLSLLMTSAISFFHPLIPGSRYVIIFSFIFGLIWLSLTRLVCNFFEINALKKGIGAKRTAIIGTDVNGQDIAEKIFSFPNYRLYYIGHITDTEPKNINFHLRDRYKSLGKIDDCITILETSEAEVVFLTEKIEQEKKNKLLRICKKKDVQVYEVIDSDPMVLDDVFVSNFDGIPFILHKKKKNITHGLIQKRCFDFLLSLLSVIVLSPVLILVGCVIKIVSPKGSIIYKQERIGLNGKIFNMYKFRTMIPNAEKDGPVMVNTEGESRYILFGDFLRKKSLDELPQLFNILKGDMSFVGPRPERHFFVEKFSKEVPNFKMRHLVPVGLTGWAQINGRSVLTSRPDQKLKYDLYYIRKRTFLLDIKIIIKTVFLVLKGEEAY